MTLSSPPSDTIRIEAVNRWDALDLAQRLKGMHTYLVQLGESRWHVCIRTEGPPDEVMPVVRRTAEAWARDRHLAAVLRVGERTYGVASG